MTAFDAGLRGHECLLELADERVPLPVGRWRGEADAADEVLLRACGGPTVDLGCGPGRLVAALVRRGVVALGVDSSAVAVALTRSRGAPAVRRDLFGRLPGAGRWSHALLADGNIGIGGDPVALLRRAGKLLRRGGSVLVEVDPPGCGLRRERARIAGGPWFDWARLDAAALAAAARRAGLRPGWVVERDGRWFAEVMRP
ncbi:SAM-dependent methyltransferase [Saccharothrix coeruleofusca]|uniref:class I SAM-dependent methyltransferase n=1 Tax=Saccharothrix coeruleofusca TaxID=33919 RepID=UPI001AE3FB98|nr:class I SAM-dependent methyltransferase [Saccharothrix coeruleofusca]MBP2340714.1 SAM-dependent methyltransferase [Saccharothrix coeruleofusca]